MIKKFYYLVLISSFSIACNESKEEVTTPELPAESSKSILDLKIDSLSALIDAHPDRAIYYAERANLWLDNRQIGSAVADADKAWSLDSTSERVLLIRGDAYFIRNQTRVSRDSWLKCIEINPENMVCRLRLAELLLAVQDFEASLTQVNEVLKLDARNPNATFMKGTIIRDLYGDTNRALQWVQKSIELKEDYVDAIDMMGVLLSAKGDPLAASYFRNALNFAPNRPDLYYKLGLAEMQQGRYNEAIEAYTTATQLDPKDADSYFNMGYIHVELKNFDIAIEFFTQAIQVRENNFKAFYGRGYCYEMLGDISNAQKDYKEALSINPDYDAALQSLARMRL
jgi:tetratricopeptide (TPR) repeat protein